MTIFFLCCDLLAALGHRDNPQCWMNTAEVLTTAIVPMTELHGNFEKMGKYLHDQGYIPTILGKSCPLRSMSMLPGLTAQ